MYGTCMAQSGNFPAKIYIIISKYYSFPKLSDSQFHFIQRHFNFLAFLDSVVVVL